MSKVSVIIPTFNRYELLRHTIRSVLCQTYTDYELVIVDDGSTDETKSTVENIISENPNTRIKYIYQQNRGVYAAINEGIRNSDGTYIAILDSDDLWIQTYLEIMVNQLEINPPVELVYCGRMLYYEDDHSLIPENLSHYPSGSIFKQMVFRKYHISYVCSIVRREAIEKSGLFDDFFRTSGDREFHYRFSKHFTYKFIPCHLVIDRRHSTINPLVPLGKDHHIQYDEQIEKYEKFWLDKLLNDEEICQAFWLSRRRITSRFNYVWGKSYFIRGNLDLAKQYLKVAIRSFPLNWKAWLYYCLSVFGFVDKKRAERISFIESHITDVDDE